MIQVLVHRKMVLQISYIIDNEVAKNTKLNTLKTKVNIKKKLVKKKN